MSKYINLDGLTWDGSSISSKIRSDNNPNNMSYITIGWLFDAPCIDLEEHDKEIYRQGRADAISEAESKIKAYASVWMSYTDGMTKKQIAQEALNSAKKAMIHILEQIKEE